MKISEYASVMDDISGKLYLVEEKGIEVPEGTKLLSPKQIVSFMNEKYIMNRLADEKVYAIAYSTTGVPLGIFLVGKGNVNGSLASTHSILRDALLLNASNVVLIHNHPAGSVKPSDADVKFFRHLKNAAQLLEINLLDSIIIGKSSYYSSSEENNQ